MAETSLGKLQSQVNKLEEKDKIIQNLTSRIQKNSTNSSKPSSTDDTYTKKGS